MKLLVDLYKTYDDTVKKDTEQVKGAGGGVVRGVKLGGKRTL